LLINSAYLALLSRTTSRRASGTRSASQSAPRAQAPSKTSATSASFSATHSGFRRYRTIVCSALSLVISHSSHR
jgi:hypothetical protein